MSYTVGLRKKLKSTGGYGLFGMCRRGTRRGEESEQESGEGRERKGKWAMTRLQNTNDTSVFTGGMVENSGSHGSWKWSDLLSSTSIIGLGCRYKVEVWEQWAGGPG